MGEEKVRTGEISMEEMTLKVVSHLQIKVERLSAERDRLHATVTEHLDHVTVNEFAALSHVYLEQGERIRLSKRAASLCQQRGIPLAKQRRKLPRGAGPRGDL